MRKSIHTSAQQALIYLWYTHALTGEGTGPGLSLSYAIIVNGHGGSINLNSIEGEGSEFIITIPRESSPNFKVKKS